MSSAGYQAVYTCQVICFTTREVLLLEVRSVSSRRAANSIGSKEKFPALFLGMQSVGEEAATPSLITVHVMFSRGVSVRACNNAHICVPAS